MNLLQAIDDPALFQPFFRAATWKPWRAFLAALFGLPMDDDALALFQASTGRGTAPQAAFREAALVIGRRGGKSRVLATIAVFLAAFFDYSPFLAPGEVATIAVLAADRKQARTIFRYAQGLFDNVPLLQGMIADSNSETIVLRNRVVIEITTASLRATRGYSYAAVLADEIAFWRSDETAANPDEEIIAAIRPGLATIPTSMLLLASSPYRRRGVLFKTYQRHHARDDARILVWQAPTATMNPGLDPAIIEEAYEEDPERAASEYGAEFRSDLSDFLPREVVESCVMPGRHELPLQRGRSYVAFVDAAGGTGTDSMTLGIAHAEGDMAVLDCLREARPRFNTDGVTAEFATVLKAYGISRVIGDRYSGDWAPQRFRTHGITYEPSSQVKSDIYVNALPLLNTGRAQLLDNPRLVSQLAGLERRTSRSGKDSIDHPPGAHDDLANAVCGALVLAAGKRGMSPEELQRIQKRLVGWMDR